MACHIHGVNIPAARKLLTQNKVARRMIHGSIQNTHGSALPILVNGFRLATIPNVMATINVFHLVHRNTLYVSF